ncbi:MAG: MMPL family transporter [Oscillospiraceae bacterium]
MKKTADFLVEKRYIILCIMLAFTVLSVFLMGKVNVNYDMTKYLPEESSMKQGMDLMESEFGSSEASTLRLMFDGLKEDDKPTVYEYLAGLPNVDSVEWEQGSDAFNKDTYTLYEINMAYDSYSDECEKLFDTVTEKYSDSYDIYTSGDIASANTPSLPTYIVALAFAILILVLFAMCNSWFEPVVFLATIGVAIVINSGTNAFLPSISDTSHSIVAIMQLVLSMDYSIILMNRYNQEKETASDKLTAMKRALSGAFSAVTSSSFTTFVGLLALVFMSFTIGADMGIALAKSVLISLLCIFTVLPALIIMSDKILVRTKKKALHIPMGGYAKVITKGRYVYLAVFVVLFAGVFLLKGNTEILYSLEENNKVDEVFSESNTLVVLYQTSDSEAAGEIAEAFEQDEHISSVTAYSNTLGRKYTATELADMMAGQINMDASAISLIYYDYFGGDSAEKVPVSDMFAFIQEISSDERYGDMLDGSMSAQLEMMAALTDEEKIGTPMSAQELSAVFGIDSQMISQLFAMSGAEKMSMREFADFLTGSVLSNPAYGAMVDQETAARLYTMQSLMGLAGKAFDEQEFAQVFGAMSDSLDKNTVSLIYLYYNAANRSDASWTMTLSQLVEYVSEFMVNDPRFAGFISDDMRDSLADMKSQLDEGTRQLEGENYGRMIFDTSYPEDSAETRAFIDRLTAECDESLEGDYYFIGSSAMDYEMSRTFSDEMNKITIITAIAIFIVVALTFRSVILPLILVAVVQCGVYTTMSIIGFSGQGMYYLALLIVQCILMGATIDYGILFTTYYRENRKTMEVRQAIEKSYDGAMHTILTSSLIMILVTGILGFMFENPTIGEICLTIAKGAFCATVLIVLILPGILAAVDKLICRKSRTEDKA